MKIKLLRSKSIGKRFAELCERIQLQIPFLIFTIIARYFFPLNTTYRINQYMSIKVICGNQREGLLFTAI